MPSTDDPGDVARTPTPTPGAAPVEGPGGPAVMVTGHRAVSHPQLVKGRLVEVLERLGPRVALSGGARGADSLFAEVALDVGVPLELVLPNRWYLHRYPDAVPAEVVAAATSVRFVVDRPEVGGWRTRWSEERWWLDNFVRNTALVDAAEVAVVVSADRPLHLAGRRRGGTAHCVRTWARRHGTRVVWVPDDPQVSVRWAPTTAPASSGGDTLQLFTHPT